MIYYVMIFIFREEEKIDPHSNVLPGVSIVIAVKNGHSQFPSFLKKILDQDYPLFEILVVDDHSDRGVLDKVIEMGAQHPQIKMIHASDTHGKKNALMIGVQKASFPIILCTDADSYPQTSHWIREMVKHSRPEGMVLGYSPYEKQKGFLNLWIRFETLLTGMQYLSWAGQGKAYMGVGRNLLFPKDWFLENQPFAGTMDIPYGDDDLLVQRAVKELAVVPCKSNESFVISQPEASWKAWWRQKHRHMSAGHQYQTSAWLKPGLLGMALIGHWVLLPVVWNACYPWVLIFFSGALMVRWIRYSMWTQKLGDRDTVVIYPVLEATYALYLAVMGMYTLINPKKKWN
jgi:glycosyltransferase involved in cell wall biosynthesis